MQTEKFMIEFMADAANDFLLQEQVVTKPWQTKFLDGQKQVVMKPWQTKKRTPRTDAGTLTHAPPGSPQHPDRHGRYEDSVDLRRKLLDHERSLKKPMSPLPSTSRGGGDADGQETAPPRKRSRPRLDFDLYEEELERRQEKKVKKSKKEEKYSDDADEVSKAEKKAMRKKNKDRDMQAVADLPEPELSEKLRARMREIAVEYNDASFDDRSPVCVLQKALSTSDISRQQNRVTIPRKQARVEFLTADEESYLSEKHGKHTNHIEVPIIEPSGGAMRLTLRKWNVGKSSVSYVLNGDWKDVVYLNQLKGGQIVQVWAFRILGRLYLAFVFSEKTPEQEKASTSQAVDEPQAETETTEDEVETAGSSGSEESNVRNFDLNMEPDDEF